MKLSTFLNQLPPGGRSDFAKHIGVAPAYLYQMVNGIRPISPKRALSIGEFSNWQVTPHELRPDIYPNQTDGIPIELSADFLDRRFAERRAAERREQERRDHERRGSGFPVDHGPENAA